MWRIVCSFLLLAITLLAHSQGDLKTAGPRSPTDELKTFQLEEGFKIELVAAEPNIIDPVAMCFDEFGRLFVCEMRGYPNGGVGTGPESRGRIRCLSDRDGDGIFETSEIFAEGLRFPMGITPWNGGVIVAVAPDIVFYPDQNRDNKAEGKVILYTGFNLANIQQMVNGLQWGADGWVHGLAGNAAGTITSPQNPKMPPLPLQSRGFRFRPDQPGSLQAMSGGGQYGLSCDDFGHWFTNTNSQHLRQIILQDRYLQRNPTVAITATTLDIPEHGAACKVFRISPFEPWRLERTSRRANSDQARRFPATELVPGGFVTSACSPVVYTADLFPKAYVNSVFICDPANNVILRDTLHELGSRFTARRGQPEKEFLASTDNWFRPTQIQIGPDGALYMLDFYREAIETPLSLPDDIKARLNLESRERGRIWRIAPVAFQAQRLPIVNDRTTEELVRQLADRNPWQRTTAQRLLMSRLHDNTLSLLDSQLQKQAGKPGLEHLLALLAERKALKDEHLLLALRDPLAGNREVALRYCEQLAKPSSTLHQEMAKLREDTNGMVRVQLALSAASLPPELRLQVLTDLLAKDASDPWALSAITLSAGEAMPQLVEQLFARPLSGSAGLRKFIRDAGAQQSRQAKGSQIEKLMIQAWNLPPDDWRLHYLIGVLQGLKRSPGGVAAYWQAHPKLAELAKERLSQWTNHFASPKTSPEEKATLAQLFGLWTYPEVRSTLLASLDPQQPVDIQSLVIQSIGQHTETEVAADLLQKWPVLGPAARREVLEQLFQSPTRLVVLLQAIEQKRFQANEVESPRVLLLKNHPTERIRTLAVKVFQQPVSSRLEIVKKYQNIELSGADVVQGQKLFKQHCATCHKIGELGHDVGPRLEAVISGKTAQDLVVSIFDPNREIDPRYVNYVANTVDGRNVTGIVSSESAAAITLTRAENISESIRRSDLESLRSSGVSLMPEGFENSLNESDTRHLLGFLMATIQKGSNPKK